MEHTPFSELAAAQRGAKIRCRVIRMWDSTNPSLQDQMMSLDFLLADEQGDCIQATVRKEDAPRIRELFQEGNIYTIANFVMSPARRKFRVSQNENLIRIGTWTIVREIHDSQLTIPFHCFTFLDDHEFESRLYNDVFLTDFIGFLISVGKLRNTYANGRLVALRSLELKTQRMTNITATLWGPIAEGFTEEDMHKEPNDKPVVAILSSMTLRAYKAETTLSSTSATRVYLNLQIPEVENFRTENPITDKITELLTSKVDNEELVPSSIPVPKTIPELLSLNRISDLGKTFKCDVTILAIDESQGWYYNACMKCKAGVSTYKGSLSCSSCGPITTLPIPWYKVTVIVTDGQAEAKFLLLGKHMEKLLKISATNLSDIPSCERNQIPTVMGQLRGNRCTFVVAINDRDFNPNELTFTVSSVIPDTIPLLQQSKITDATRTDADEEKIDDNQGNKRPRQTKPAPHDVDIVAKKGTETPGPKKIKE